MGKDRASLEVEGTALHFVCADAEKVNAAKAEGISRAGNVTHRTLAHAEASRKKGEKILVVDSEGAVLNLKPYRKPKSVTAAGGLVVRQKKGEIRLLMIYRRGAWDLPKGKIDKGETIPECALREVQEEVGIDVLRIIAPAGTTVHGYPEGKRFMVKRTWWYFMETPERDFTPEKREGIEKVKWVRWSKAKEKVGYRSLRRHLAGLHPALP